MGRNKGSTNRGLLPHKPKQQRNDQINFRVSQQQKELINRMSNESGLSVANMILKALEQYGLTSYSIVRSNITVDEIHQLTG